MAIISGMKKNIAICTLIIFTLLLLFGCVGIGRENPDFLRIHIRANSDSQCDQEVKLTVRDSLIGYLSPLLRNAKTRNSAEKIIIAHKDGIEKAVDELLYSCGYYYGCEVYVDTEYFDKRSYENLTLEEGYYKAIIVNLGTGKGKNWWCVAFPPLCFTSEDYDNVNYKSILYEIVKKYSDKEKK